MNQDTKHKKAKREQHKIQQSKPLLKVPDNYQNKWIWFGLAVILLATFAIYFRAIRFDLLIWDDNLYINENEHIKALKWVNIKLFFTEFYVGNYQPITILTYAIENKLAGYSPALYHFSNIMLHIANTFLVFTLIRKIAPQNANVALITAALFAVHPMHVESVAWVAERKDVLYTFFFLLSLITYTNYLKTEKFKLLVFTGLFFLLSALSKSAAVILPLVMLLFDYYLNRTYSWKMIFEKIPFFAVSLILGIVALNSQKLAMPDTPIIGGIDRFFVISDSFITYIFKAFIPVKLSALYPYPKELGGTLPAEYYVSIVFIGLLLYFVWYSRKWGKDIVFGFLFFIITIILVLQIVSIGNATMADRYTYVPFIGLFFMVGKLFEYFAKKGMHFYKNCLLGLIVLGCILFSYSTYARIEKWENDGILFSDVLLKYPSNTLALNNSGCYYLKIAQEVSTDNSARRDFYFQKSFQDFNKLIEINPEYIHCYYNRGLLGFFLKNYTHAIKDFDNEIQRNPNYAEAYFYRANSKKESSDFAGAILDFDKVIVIKPTAETYYNRGNAKLSLSDFNGALKDWDKAIELNPKLLKAYNNRSLLKCSLKDYAGAVADYDKMIELNPQDTTTIKNREIIQALLESNKK